MWRDLCKYRCLKQVEKTFPLHILCSRNGAFFVAIRKKSINAVNVSKSNSDGIKSVNKNAVDAATRFEKGRLLQRLVWRAKNILFSNALNTEKIINAEKKKQEKALDQPQPRVFVDTTLGLCDVEWGEVARSMQDGLWENFSLSCEESVTLLCELLAVALKLRRSGASPEFLSPKTTMMVPPLKATEAIYSPLSRQARLWEEQREWHVLLACAAATFRRICDGCVNEAELRNVVRQFLDKLEDFCLPSAVAMAKGRLRSQKKGDKKKVFSSPRDTLSNTLWRLTMLCRVVEGLLLCEVQTNGPSTSLHESTEKSAEDAKENVEKKARFEVFVQCVMQEVERRVFTFYNINEAVEQIDGLEALVKRAFYYCFDFENADTHPCENKGGLKNALLSFCGAYFKIMPFSLLVSAARPPGMSDVNGDDCCAIAVLRAIRQSWLRQESSMHLHGVQRAFWWLQLVPVFFEAFFDFTTQLAKKETNIDNTHKAFLETAQKELLDMLCSMLYFDEKAFEERRAILSAQKNSVEDADTGETGGIISNPDGDNGVTTVSGDIANTRRLRRHRGGRSLFKKGDDKEAVLLPSSTETLRKSFRFSSRRASAVVGERSKKAAVCGLGDILINSPLFDMIVASKEAASQLSDLFAVENIFRSSALETTWLALLTAHRRVQETRLTLSLLQSQEPQQQQQQPRVAMDLVKAYELRSAEGKEEKEGEGASRLTFPSFVAASLQHFATALAAGVFRVYEMTDPMYLRDGNIRRTVGVAIVAGTQETLLENYFYSDALASNWWLRSGASFLFYNCSCCGHGNHLYLPPLSMMLEGRLMNLLTQRTSRHKDLDWLRRSTNTALSCLFTAFSASATASLLPVTKQWTAALIVANLRDVLYLITTGTATNSSGSYGLLLASKEKQDEKDFGTKELRKWAFEVFSSLLSILVADKELLLFSGYAGFIDVLFELHSRLKTDEEEIAEFLDKAFFKVLFPAVLISLTKSAEKDNSETHAAMCESALFVIAQISRFVFLLELKLPSGLHTEDSDSLITVALYCFRHARRVAGKQPSGYGLPVAQLPQVKDTHVMNISAAVSYLLDKNNNFSYLHVLDASNSLLSFSKLQTLSSDRESGCVSALQHYLQSVPRVSLTLCDQKKLLEESVKYLGFMASNPVSAHVVGYLVRFIEHHLRMQERLSRIPHGNLIKTDDDGQRENALSSLTRIEAAPLVLLDYIAYLTCGGGWTMVTWAFNLAETSLRIQRKHQLATTTSLADVATRAILSQLRALSTTSRQQRLPQNLLKSILCLSDIMSGSPTTLLGFERSSLLFGLFNNTKRGEYRIMLFALKQAVLHVQMMSLKYRLPRSQSHRHVDEDDEEVLHDNNAKQLLEKGALGGSREETYFTTCVATHSSDEKRQLRIFLNSLVACFDAVLDVVRGCALQQDVFDDELRDILLLALQTLLRVLQGCLQAVLQVPHDAWAQFDEERAHVLWVALCVAALLGRTVAVDYGRICFTGNIRRSTESVLDTIGEMIELCTSGAATAVVNNHGGCDGDIAKNMVGKQCKVQKRVSKSTPLVDLLTTSVKTILGDPQVSYRLAVRLGLGMRQRSDLTALVFAVRVFAVASARYKPAGSLVNRLWRAMCVEVAGAKVGLSTKRGKRVDDAPVNNTLCVPSKDELRLLLESFNDFEKELKDTATSRKAQSRQADFVLDWVCQNSSAFLDSVREDQTLPHNEESHDAVFDGEKTDVDELSLDGALHDVLLTNATSVIGMDAAVLLQEEGKEEDGNDEDYDAREANIKVSNVDFLKALINQCCRVQMSSGAVIINDTTLPIPQTAKVVTTHYECVKAAFNRCTLTEIMAFPGAESIFATLDIFSHKRSPISKENCRGLWQKLADGWKKEFLYPQSESFEEAQRELLQLVRRRRSLLRLTEKDGTGVDAASSVAAGFSIGSFFSLKGNVMADLAKHDMPPVTNDVELLPHDDVSGLKEEQKESCLSTVRNIKSRVDFFLEQQSKQQHVPLNILLTLLIDISSGARFEAEMENLARVVITYVARRHILLRERTDKHVMNVIKFLGGLEKNNARVYERRRLPLSCAHAADVAGWFLTSEDRQTFMKTFAVYAGVGDNVGKVVCSAEHGFFEYVRSACLYLHLLALAAHLCHRFRMFSEIDYADAAAQKRQQQQQQQQRGGYNFSHDDGRGGGKKIRRGGGGGDGNVAQWGAICGQEVDARLAELRIRADSRQTDVDSVNTNLLENILLHFLNVGLAVVDHADFVTHRATSIAVTPNTNHEHTQKALLYADELRLMVAVALQDTLRVLLRDAPLEFSLARRVANRIMCSFSCDLNSTTLLTGACAEQQRERPKFPPVDPVALEAWRFKRPELFVRSPTLLCVLSPSFFNGVFSQHISSASSSLVTQVVAALRFYLRRPDVHLAPLMAATTSILSSTYVRNAALRFFCEELCGQIVERPSFREALAPPTVASAQQGGAGSVPNEVLIPFLAAICREDASVGKNALAAVLYHSMHLRLDVFGQPPTANRLAKLAITKRGGNTGNNSNNSNSMFSASDGSAKGRLSLGVQHKDVLLETPMSFEATGTEVVSSLLNTEDDEQDELETLGRFKPDQSDETATRTHKHALASLNLTLAEVMETAMHFAAMRQPSLEDLKKARAMIRSADDARHERIAAYRSAMPVTNAYSDAGGSFPAEGSVSGHPDVALRIEEPMHFGVVLLHIRFALRKIIHISMRRLASQQGPRTLSMMVEMLREIDPKWHKGGHSGGSSGNNTNNNAPRRQSDGMLAGTLRVLVARSVMCVDFAGEDAEAVGGGAGGIAISSVGLRRAKRALYTVQRAKYYNDSSGGSDGENRDDADGEEKKKWCNWNGANYKYRRQQHQSGTAGVLHAAKRFSARGL